MAHIIEWIGDAATGHLRLLDQTKLPLEETYLDCTTIQEVWQAIRQLSVRGAPAIGVSAAYAAILPVQGGGEDEARRVTSLQQGCDHLATSRPTAVNLFWALNHMKQVRPATPEKLLQEARRIDHENAQMTQRIGEHALTWLRKIGAVKSQGLSMLTHCNAGALACGGIGTATAPMYLAHRQGVSVRVFADETRPLLQGARLTAYELKQAGIDVTLICDNMAAQVMREGRIDAVIVGADRIAANGDTANKVGTYGLAILAAHHRVPFIVAAPSSTFDLSLADGSGIPIEQRDSREITQGMGKQTAATGTGTYNPAFDVTPASLIRAIVTERGVIEPVNPLRVREVLG